jgi:inner membrane protein involved in colicin E2 resistance
VYQKIGVFMNIFVNLYNKMLEWPDGFRRLVWLIIDVILLYLTGFLVSITKKEDWALIITTMLLMITIIVVFLRVMFDDWEFFQ